MIPMNSIALRRRRFFHLALACGSVVALTSQGSFGQSGSVPVAVPPAPVLAPAPVPPTPAAENVAEVPPVNPSTERSVVFRRLCIDILGRLPTAQELEEFLKDTSPQAYG